MNPRTRDWDGPVDLVPLVTDHVPSGDDQHHRIAIEVMTERDDAWRRDQFYPGHFTASGFVANPSGSAVLLIHHGKLRRWLQPGGHIEVDDDTIESAIRREVAEETGIRRLERLGDGLLHIDAHPIPAHGDEPRHIHIDLTMGFRALDDEIGALAEVSDARWVPFDDLGTLNTDDAVRRGVARLRQLLP